jgi:hypothetical protein
VLLIGIGLAAATFGVLLKIGFLASPSPAVQEGITGSSAVTTLTPRLPTGQLLLNDCRLSNIVLLFLIIVTDRMLETLAV